MPFFSTSTFYVLIGAVTLGFVIAMVWTNIHKTAVSTFINYLCDNNIFDNANAVTLSNLQITGVSAYIIERSVSKNYGLGKYIEVIKGKKSNDNLEAMLEGKESDKYFLKNTDVEMLEKKYSYAPLSNKLLILFVAAIIATAILSTFALKFIFANHTSVDIDTDKETQQQEITEKMNNEQNDDDETIVDEQTNQEDIIDSQDVQEPDISAPLPSIPA